MGNVKIWQDGEWVDLDLNATYNLAGYNYTLRDLGDGFAMFDGAVNVLDYVMEDYMVLANYIKSFPVNENGLHEIPVDDERYASVYGEGRISIFQGFEDVAIDTFYFEPVMWALEMGITTGVTDTTFAPGREIMRAEAVTFLWRAAGSPDPTGVNPFVDVKDSDFFCKAAVWAYEQGITTGTTATTFSPYKTCTRAEVVTFLWRAEGQPEPTTAENPFVDVKNTDFYYTAVLWAVEKGITNGMDTTHFGPLLVCNRAQVVTFLYRTAQLAETEPEEPEQPEDPELPVDPDTTYSITIKTKGEATAFSEVGEAAAGEVVYFMVDPEYGWVLTGVESFPTNEGIVLYYMGANVYELTMPARDVVLTFVYEEAQGSAHYITTNCTGGVAVADCDFDDDLNDFAKAGEYVLFMVLPDEGMTLDLETDVSVKVNGNAYDGWFAIGEMEGIYLFEVYMPDADLTVDITCTSGNGANAAAARIPVTVE